MQHPWEVNKVDMLTVPNLHAKYNPWPCVRSVCSILQFKILSVQSNSVTLNTSNINYMILVLPYRSYTGGRERCVFVQNTLLPLRACCLRELKLWAVPRSIHAFRTVCTGSNYRKTVEINIKYSPLSSWI
jgi:hypothetical protein